MVGSNLLLTLTDNSLEEFRKDYFQVIVQYECVVIAIVYVIFATEKKRRR